MHAVRSLLAALVGLIVLGALLAAPAPLVRPVPREWTNSIGMKLIRIPAGKFVMGSSPAEVGHQVSEGPQHEVEITRAFYLGVHEVTQAQLRRILGTDNSYFSPTGRGSGAVKGLDTSDFPAEHVTYDRAVEFCRKLSELAVEKGARRVYRLPTEAEWEYACRAGTNTTYYFGNVLDRADANFISALNRTTKVGSYRANAWGLHDMHGNVFEWCSDWYDANYYRVSPRKDPAGPNNGTYRVLRGGCWSNPLQTCRSAHRLYFSPSFGETGGIGLRVACDVGGRAR